MNLASHLFNFKFISWILILLITHLKFSPPSEISCAKPAGKDFTNAFKSASSKACQIVASVYCSNGSRFMRNVPEKRTGSYNKQPHIYKLLVNLILTRAFAWFATWGMIVIRPRKSCNPSRPMFCPSMKIVPFAASMRRKRANVSDDLPAPVRPTIPTWPHKTHTRLIIITNHLLVDFSSYRHLLSGINCARDIS